MGELSVMLGDGVKKGDLLINGIIINKHDTPRYVHSLGNITGTYKESVTFEQPLNEVQNIPTGETITKKSLYFFGFNIPLSIGKVEGNYSCSDKTNYMYFLGAELPLGITYSHYDMYEEVELSYSFEDAEIIIKDKIKDFETNFLSDTVILKKTITNNSISGTAIYKADYLLEGEIGTQSQIIVD